MQIKAETLPFTRTLDVEALDADTAHAFFQSHSQICSGILEDPTGLGTQFVISSSGSSQWLKEESEAAVFFLEWKRNVQQHNIDYPSLRHVFYVAYEAGCLFEKLPKPKTVPEGGLIWRHEPDWCICFSPHQEKVYISSIECENKLNELEALVLSAFGKQKQAFSYSGQVKEPILDYKEAVERVREYVSQGDIFQANIARFWEAPLQDSEIYALYSKLRKVNPAPFSCCIKADELTIASASPERLFSIDSKGKVTARPIAGTRKRSEGDEDDILTNELLLSDKERAEHIMLLDLERNDLGRVCTPGSIHVDECMVIEKYATVQHIVSNVTGQLNPAFDMIDVLGAMFPGGTITGCPKVRCMEIIHELESNARGPYTGGIGYIAWDGSVDMNILIRTFWHWKGMLKWAAGAGIVADSIPEHEELETEHKVAGLMRVFDD